MKLTLNSIYKILNIEMFRHARFFFMRDNSYRIFTFLENYRFIICFLSLHLIIN